MKIYFLFKKWGIFQPAMSVSLPPRVLCSVSSLKLGRESRLKEEDDDLSHPKWIWGRGTPKIPSKIE